MNSQKSAGINIPFLVLAGVLILAVIIFLGTRVGNADPSGGNTPEGFPMPTPTSIKVSRIIPVTGGNPPESDAKEIFDVDFATIDRELNSAARASVAYNAPREMNLGASETVELLINHSISEKQLVKQLASFEGYAILGEAEITPKMKAEIISHDVDAFSIRPIHDDPLQLVGGSETTRWSWIVTPRKRGEQTLTIVLYRVVKYEDEDYWREVETYRSDVDVKVTFLGQLKALDWKWIIGILVTALLIPGFWRWYDQQKKAGKQDPQKG